MELIIHCTINDSHVCMDYLNSYLESRILLNISEFSGSHCSFHLFLAQKILNIKLGIDFRILIALQPNVVDLRYFKL